MSKLEIMLSKETSDFKELFLNALIDDVQKKLKCRLSVYTLLFETKKTIDSWGALNYFVNRVACERRSMKLLLLFIDLELDNINKSEQLTEVVFEDKVILIEIWRILFIEFSKKVTDQMLIEQKKLLNEKKWCIVTSFLYV